MKSSRTLLAALALSASAQGLKAAEASQETGGPSTDVLPLAALQLFERDLTVVSFAKSGAALSEGEALALKALYERTRSDPSVKSFVVAAWADKAGLGKDLSEAQLRLAQKRAEAVKKVLADLGARRIQSHNMAQDAKWVSRLFRSEDAELKEAMKHSETGRSEDPELRELADQLEKRGGPGRVVVIVERDPKLLTTGR